MASWAETVVNLASGFQPMIKFARSLADDFGPIGTVVSGLATAGGLIYGWFRKIPPKYLRWFVVSTGSFAALWTAYWLGGQSTRDSDVMPPVGPPISVPTPAPSPPATTPTVPSGPIVVPVPLPANPPRARLNPQVKGVMHVVGFGDQEIKEKEWIGTKGQSRATTGFSLSLNTKSDLLQVEYRCHVQDIGDIGWLSAGAFCGTRGGKRLEAVEIRLVGREKSNFSIKYDCHLQDFGDLLQISDGETCGTRGQSRRLEALRVWIERREQ